MVFGSVIDKVGVVVEVDFGIVVVEVNVGLVGVGGNGVDILIGTALVVVVVEVVEVLLDPICILGTVDDESLIVVVGNSVDVVYATGMEL